MSFGYSVGDLIGGANMVYQLIRVLKDTRGSSIEYQEAMLELGSMQQAFLQVSQLCHNPVIPRATINSASYIVMSAMDTISGFLDKSHDYQQRLGGGHSSRGGQHSALDMGDSWAKIGWALYKKEELKQLRDSLHSRLSSISLLLSVSAYCNPIPQEVAKYQVPQTKEEAEMAREMIGHALLLPAPVAEPPNTANAALVIQPSDCELGIRPQIAEAGTCPPRESGTCTVGRPECVLETGSEGSLSTGGTTLVASDGLHPVDESLCQIGDDDNHESTAHADDSIEDVQDMEQNETLVSSDSSFRDKQAANLRIARVQELSNAWIHDLTMQRTEPVMIDEIRKIIANGIKDLAGNLSTIYFKDAVGRKFTFPLRMARTYKGIHELIKMAFCQVDRLGPQVQAGHYDLIGPNGEIILPAIWESVIGADMAITMHMWPIIEPIRMPPLTPVPRRAVSPSVLSSSSSDEESPPDEESNKSSLHRFVRR